MTKMYEKIQFYQRKSEFSAGVQILKMARTQGMRFLLRPGESITHFDATIIEDRQTTVRDMATTLIPYGLQFNTKCMMCLYAPKFRHVGCENISKMTMRHSHYTTLCI